MYYLSSYLCIRLGTYDSELVDKVKFAVKAAPVSQLQQVMQDFDLLIEFCKLSIEMVDFDKQ